MAYEGGSCKGAHSLFNLVQCCPAQLKKVRAGGHVDVKDVILPLAGSGQLGNSRRDDGGPVFSEVVDERAHMDVELLEGCFHDLREGDHGWTELGGIPINRQTWDDGVKKLGNLLVMLDIARGQRAANRGGGNFESIRGRDKGKIPCLIDNFLYFSLSMTHVKSVT